MSHKEETKLTRTLSVRFTQDMLDEIAELSKLAPIMLSQQDIIRLALEVGLRDMRDSKLNLPDLIRAQAEANRAAEGKQAGNGKE